MAAGAGAAAPGSAAAAPTDPAPTFQPILRLVGAKEIHADPGQEPLPEGAELVIAGTKVVELSLDSSARSMVQGPSVSEIDVSGLVIVPGFVDIHMHLSGGGGEAGFRSRTPEAQLSELVEAGITTAVGILGTDSVARSPQALLAKVKGLKEDGLSAYMWTGAYAMPPPTVSGSVKLDIMVIEECIGVGEIAISDHRSSCPSVAELRQLVAEARVAGMLSGKGGVTYCHMGSGDGGLAPLWEVVRTSSIPMTNIVPTHMSRSPRLIQQGKAWVAGGGYVDFTSGEDATAGALLEYWRTEIIRVAAASRVVCSTDAYGSQPKFDDAGRLVGYSAAPPSASLELLRRLVAQHGVALSVALPPFTANAAAAVGLRKGRLHVGEDADLLVLDPGDGLALRYVISRGRVLKTPGWTAQGMFEGGV